MARDRIYADGGGEESPPFEFSESVVRVFPDMIERSVPGYAQMVAAAELFARAHVTSGSRVYDLGCSLGAACLAARRGIKVPDVKIIAVDASPAMIQRFARELDDPDHPVPVQLHTADILETPIENASLVLVYFTLQFLAHDARAELIRRIHDGLNPGGVLVLAEKFRFDDPGEQDWLTRRHEDFKRLQGYSEAEIRGKRRALENVMRPDTRSAHHQRLHSAGFERVVDWFQHLSFGAMAAFRAGP